MAASSYAPTHTTRLSKARSMIISGQIAVSLDGATQDEWFVLRGIGPNSFERAAIFIDTFVPLCEYDVVRTLYFNRNCTAENYVRSYLRWFDTRRLQIIPHSNTIDATTMRWRAPGSRCTQTFPAREVFIVHRLRHMSVACFANDMRTTPFFDLPFFRFTDERHLCRNVWSDIQVILDGQLVWRSVGDVDLAEWQGLRHERSFNDPFRHGRDVDTEVRVRQHHGLFSSHHNTEFWEVPATIRALVLPWLSSRDVDREVSSVLLVHTSRTYVYFGRYFFHVDHNSHFIRPTRSPFENAHVREQLGILADVERSRDTLVSFLSREFHGVPYLDLGDLALTCEWGRFTGVLVQLPDWAPAWADTNAHVVLTGSGVPYHLARLALELSRRVDWDSYGSDQFLELTGPFFLYDPYTSELDDLPARRAGDRYTVNLVVSCVRFLQGDTVSHLRSLDNVASYVTDRFGSDLLRDDVDVDRGVLRDSSKPGDLRDYRDYPFGRDWVGTGNRGDGILDVLDEPPVPVSPPTAVVPPPVPPPSSVVPTGFLLSLPSLGPSSPDVPSLNISSADRKRIEAENREGLNRSILVPIRASLVSHNVVPACETVESSLPNLEWIPRIYDQLLDGCTDAYRAGSSARKELVTLRASNDSLRARAGVLESAFADSEATITRLEAAVSLVEAEGQVLGNNLNTLQVDNTKLQQDIVTLRGRLEAANRLGAANAAVETQARIHEAQARESSARIAQLERDLLVFRQLAQSAVATTETNRDNYRRCFAGAHQRGNAFFSRLQQAVVEHCEEYARDVSVARVAAGAEDPGLIDFVTNFDPSSSHGPKVPRNSHDPDVPRSPGSYS